MQRRGWERVVLLAGEACKYNVGMTKMPGLEGSMAKEMSGGHRNLKYF